MKKKVLISAGAIAIAVTLGLGIYQSDASQADPKLSYDDVTNLISSQYPGTITEMELEKERNRAVYEIEIENEGMEYDLKVDANSGEIIKLKEKRIAVNQEDTKKEIIEVEKEQTNDNKDDSNDVKQETKIAKKESTSKKEKSKNTVIDAKKAIAIAQKEFPGTVTDVDLDEDDGRLIYEIEIKNNGIEAEFEIDAMTGEIIVIEMDED